MLSFQRSVGRPILRVGMSCYFIRTMRSWKGLGCDEAQNPTIVSRPWEVASLLT